MLRLISRPRRVGRLLGIPILVSPLVLLILGLLLAEGARRAGLGALGEVLGLIGLVLVSLLVHELAHALAARRLGVRVHDVTIGPLGGMARMEGVSDRPRVEGRVAAAGPGANLALAAAFLLVPGAWGQAGVWINLVFGLGNLLPAFPLDGGRMLRAWLAGRAPLLDATRAAVTVSHWVMIAALAAAAWFGLFPLTLLLCAFLFWSGREEELQILLRTGTASTADPYEVLARAVWRQRAEAGEVPEAEDDDEAPPPQAG